MSNNIVATPLHSKLAEIFGFVKDLKDQNEWPWAAGLVRVFSSFISESGGQVGNVYSIAEENSLVDVITVYTQYCSSLSMMWYYAA